MVETEDRSCRVCVESSELKDETLICVKRSKKGRIFYIDNPGRVAKNCDMYFDEQGFSDLVDTLEEVEEIGGGVLDEFDGEFDDEEIEFNVD